MSATPGGGSPTVTGMPIWISLALALVAGTAAACPRPAIVPPEVPLGGCPTVRPGACTAHCLPTMTHLVLDHGGPLATLGGLWAMSRALVDAGWTIDPRRTQAPRLVVLARRGHDRMSLVVALDRPPRVEVTFAPG